MFVTAIRPETREVVIGPADELLGHQVIIEEVNWLAEPLDAESRVWVQCRYRAAAVPAVVLSNAGHRLTLALEEPVRAITPGQSGALYTQDGRLLGGGVIALPAAQCSTSPSRRLAVLNS